MNRILSYPEIVAGDRERDALVSCNGLTLEDMVKIKENVSKSDPYVYYARTAL